MGVMIFSGVNLILWSFSTVIVLVSYFEAMKCLATGLLNTITMSSMCWEVGLRCNQKVVGYCQDVYELLHQ